MFSVHEREYQFITNPEMKFNGPKTDMLGQFLDPTISNQQNKISKIKYVARGSWDPTKNTEGNYVYSKYQQCLT